jgi:hypothetical protein
VTSAELKQTEAAKELLKGLDEKPNPKRDININVIQEKEREEKGASMWEPLSAFP